MPHSYFDRTKTINLQNWAITLARSVYSEHAQLIVEGVTEQDKYFCQYAHFVGPMTSRAGLINGSYLFWSKKGEVKPFKDIKPERLKIGGSKTWIVSKDRAGNLINHVNGQLKKRPFNITGDISYGSVGELLLLGKEYLKAFPDMLLELSAEALQGYLLYSFLQFAEFSKEFSLLLSTILIGIKDVFHQTALEGKWLIYRTFFATTQHPQPFINTLQEPNFDEMDKIIDDISDLDMPNNCFTWAQKELENAGIHINRGWFPRTRNALT